MNEPPMTIRRLAGLLGVSDATVSLALRNHPSISAPTRERVQSLAREHNYRGNVLVSALLAQVRRGRVDGSGEAVALLLEGSAPNTAPAVVEGVEMARRRARLVGLRLEVFLLGRRGEQSASVNRVLFNRGIRGVIVGPVPLDLKPLTMDWERYACVAVGYSFQQQVMHRAANAHFAGLMTCYEQLRKSGCKRIGCVLGRDEDARSRYFWQAAARNAPHVFKGAVIPPLMMDEPLQRARFEQWCKRHRPDAVIANYPDYVADWIAQLGLEVSYATLDLHDGRPWRGIRQSWEGIFSAAVDQLAGELARNEFGLPAIPKTTLVEGQWVEGKTSAVR